MDTSSLKNFAGGARSALHAEVAARLAVVLAEGSTARAEQVSAVSALTRAVERDGRDVVVERVAYTWFNRIIALRFMDANGYTGAGVVSPEAGKDVGQPQVLSDAKGGEFDAEVVNAKLQEDVTALLNGSRQSSDGQGEAYGLLLEAYCRFWNRSMPFMFEREGDYTELLMPTGLLASDSIRDRAVRTMTTEACSEVEVIGWLYQFYISERKDEVFAGFKKNKKAGAAEIPAATQLFTPHWIVRYLVENSVGRLWLLNHPESRLAEQMDYYIAPVDEETDFLKVGSPEELRIIDPAVGSGHMLTYAFDLLYAIYEEQAYSPSEIPAKILEHNLHGVEIDPRAGALAAFALTMKAAAKRKLFLKTPVQPNICVLQNVHFEEDDLDYLWSLAKGISVARADFDAFWNAFEHADNFGSLIQPNDGLIQLLAPIAEQLETTGNFLSTPLRTVVAQSAQLSEKYNIVVANPPYMGTRNMTDALRGWAERQYPTSNADLCTMFLERSIRLVPKTGLAALVVSESWMFNNSFEQLRQDIAARSRPVVTACIDKAAFGVRLNTAASVFVRDGAQVLSQFFRVRSAHLLPHAPRSLPVADEPIYEVDVRSFSNVQGSAFIFDMPPALLKLYETVPTVGDSLDVKQGLATADNAKFVRLWWEVSRENIGFGCPDRTAARESGRRWFPYNKGGTPVPWWGNQDYVVNWGRDGEEIRAFGTEAGGRPRSRAQNTDYYFRSAVTWSNIGSAGARFRHIPDGFVFDIAGMSAFRGSPASQLSLLGYLNSTIVRAGLDVLAPTLNYQIGDVGRLPMLDEVGDNERVEELVELSRGRWSQSETAHSFAVSALERARHSRLDEVVEKARSLDRSVISRINSLERESDDFWAAEIAEKSGQSLSAGHALRAIETPSAAELTIDLLSYAVGTMFGRYSLDEPGLILANQGDTIREYLAKVPDPSFLPDADNVIPIVDGDWFQDDIVGRFRQFLRVAFGEEHFEENLRFVIESLGMKDLRDYFVKSFYKDHVQRYKKRPIYWLFSSPKGSFTALVYLHRYTPTTVSTVLNEYLREFIKKLEVSLEQQTYIVASGAAAREVAAAQKEADRLRKVLIELDDYERQLHTLASQQVELDLDDGVMVNYQKFGSALRDIGLNKGGANG